MLGGYDRYIYGELFDEVADVRLAGGDVKTAYIFELYASEWGFSWLNVGISYITANRYIFYFDIDYHHLCFALYLF